MVSIRKEQFSFIEIPTHKEDLWRIWGRPGAELQPNPSPGTGRADCPVRPVEYFALYFTKQPLTALQETRLLTERGDGSAWMFSMARAQPRLLSRYRTDAPLKAVSLDEHEVPLGLDKATLIQGKAPYQEAALALKRLFKADLQALCWRSKHREAKGLVIAMFDDAKAAVGLHVVDTVNLLDHDSVAEVLSAPTIVLS